MKKNGFTLIELLVVIAIIAILAAILFPIFIRVQQTARLAKCQSNAKQLSTAAMLYEGDCSGIMPGYIKDQWSGQMWYVLIDKYLKQIKKKDLASGSFDLSGVYICPSMPLSRAITTADVPNVGDPLPMNLQRCYGYNYGYLGGYQATAGGPCEYHKPGEVVKTTKTIRFLETWNFQAKVNWTQGRGTAYCYAPVRLAGFCTQTYCWPPGWHNGRSTVVWFDGHVTNVRLAPPGPVTSDAYTGVMQKYFQNDGIGTHADPYFRLDAPKP